MTWGLNNCTECGSSLHDWKHCPKRSDEVLAEHRKQIAARLLTDVGLTKERVRALVLSRR